MSEELEPCIHLEVCDSGCDVDPEECEYYRPERTCTVVSQICKGTCLEDNVVRLSCGHLANGTLDHPPNYCSECGAKVVDE